MSASHLVLGIATAGAPEIALVGAACDITLASDRGALESVAQLLDQALGTAGIAVSDITLIGVCTGPGSFTGLRIGVAFARTLAQTLDLPIAGISSYDAVACGISSYPLISVARGKKNYYYARVEVDEASKPRFIQGSKEVIERTATELGVGKTRVVVAGPDFSSAPPGAAARAVAQLALQAHGRREDLRWTNIAIDYGQRPNAVVNWEKRHRAD